MNTILLQACCFRRRMGAPEESGVAKVAAFGLSDVDWIVDMLGKRVGPVWDYRLIEGPLSHMRVEWVPPYKKKRRIKNEIE